MKRNLSEVQKIVLAAMFLALAVVMTYVAKLIQPAGGYLRFSLTPAIIVFGSMIVGPAYGIIIGAGSDFINAVVINQGEINYLITFVYGLMGVAPYFLANFAKKHPKLLNNPYIIWGSFAAIFVSIAVVLLSTNVVADAFFRDGGYKQFFGSVELGTKIAALGIFAAALIATCVALYFMNKSYVKRNLNTISPYQLAFVALISEVVFMLLGKSLAFYFWYSFLSSTPGPFFFWGPFSVLLIAMPINILIIVGFNGLLLPISRLLIRERGVTENE